MAAEEEPTLDSVRIYQGRVVGLRVDTVRLPHGGTSQREIVEHGAAVVLVPIDPQGRVLMVRQYRKPIERSLLELPAGGIDPGESPEEAARRELQEETGFLPGVLEPLGGFYSAPGFCEEYLHLFLATELTPSARPPDEDENIDLVPVAWEQVPGLLESGGVCDAKSVAGLLRVWARQSHE